MTRTYPKEVKAQAVRRLLACEDETVISQGMDIPVETLRAWRQELEKMASRPDADTLPFLRERLIDNVMQLADSLDKAIDEAPLNQRAGALAQLVDRLIKLAEKLGSNEGQSGKVWTIEHKYPDGSRHPVPPWAGTDSEE
jgi:transposase-like protein